MTGDRTPSGCRYCGLPERGHFQRWHESVHWHIWFPPLQHQIKERMLARRADRITAHEPTSDLREHFAGLADSECGEHRTVGTRAWCYRDGEWCSPYAPCRGCELPALRERAEEAERLAARYRMQVDDPDSLLTALDDAERQRDEALAAVQRVRDLCARGPGPDNEYQIWTADVLAALEPPEGT